MTCVKQAVLKNVLAAPTLLHSMALLLCQISEQQNGITSRRYTKDTEKGKDGYQGMKINIREKGGNA